jgi:hypothetical protein
MRKYMTLAVTALLAIAGAVKALDIRTQPGHVRFQFTQDEVRQALSEYLAHHRGIAVGTNSFLTFTDGHADLTNSAAIEVKLRVLPE